MHRVKRWQANPKLPNKHVTSHLLCEITGQPNKYVRFLSDGTLGSRVHITYRSLNVKLGGTSVSMPLKRLARIYSSCEIILTNIHSFPYAYSN